jgi:hypothetical protein
VAIDISPAIWVRIGELVRCDANDISIMPVYIEKYKRQLSPKAVVTIPKASSGSELRSRIFRKRVEVDVVEGITRNTK